MHNGPRIVLAAVQLPVITITSRKTAPAKRRPRHVLLIPLSGSRQLARSDRFREESTGWHLGSASLGHDLSHIFQQHQQMERIAGGREEVKVLIKPFGLLIFGMDQEGANANNVCRLKRPQHGVLE